VASGTYIPANAQGFYDDGSGVQRPCPAGRTALPGKAISEADCKDCVSPLNSLGDPCGEWTCKLGWSKLGDNCFDPNLCISSVGYSYADVSGRCVPTALPWQPAGYEKIKFTKAEGLEVYVQLLGQLTTKLWIGTIISRLGYMIRFDFHSSPYGQSKRHWMSVAGYQDAELQVQLPGQVCSSSALNFKTRLYSVVAFCNTTFLSFLDMSLASPVPRLLIGSNVSGYQEGFRDTARFGHILYMATELDEGVIYVMDSLNCALRMVKIPTWPGDFLTRSYWVYGASAGTCKTGVGTLLNGGRLFMVYQLTHFMFTATGGLYQFDRETRNVVHVIKSAFWPDWLPDLSQLLDATLLNGDTGKVRLVFENSGALLTPLSLPCPTGFTSFQGAKCTRPCSTTENYVDLTTGECRPCFTRNCVPGEEKVLCTPNSPQTCIACPVLEPAQGLYPRIYNLPDQCTDSNIKYTTFCPRGKYLSSTIINGAAVCNDCPPFSNTLTDGATTIEQCRCFEGATRIAPGQCRVGQLYPLPTLSKCPFGRYQRGAFERCSSCRLDPFPRCATGLYALINGSCAPCVVPGDAEVTSEGVVINSPTSCGFLCLPGFYPMTNVSFASRCQPCTNAPIANGGRYYAVSNGQQDSPNGCTWQCWYPFKIFNVQCVPCAPWNPLHPGLPCTSQWLVVNASVGEGRQAVLANVTYRIIQFNTSGSIWFSENTTVDLLLVGGGGAGGQAGYGAGAGYGGGAGGGGGAGQVLLRYNVTLRANVTYPVVVGAGGAWVNWLNVPGGASSVAGVTAIPGGTGGAGLNGAGAAGSAGASGGGSGSVWQTGLVMGGTGLAGYAGGRDVNRWGTVGAGGGGAGCVGGSTNNCLGGQGGCGVVMWGNASSTFFFPGGSPALAGGGGGGYGIQGCAPGQGLDGGGQGGGLTALTDEGAGNGVDALPNTGAGGGGATRVFVPLVATTALGGAGGSGLVVVRFVDETCVCAN
jgi:hypothetical protein